MSTNQPPFTSSSDLETEAEEAWAEVETALSNLQKSGTTLDEVWAKFSTGAVDADIHDDAPLKLEDAICLPELAGIFTVNPDFREQSPSLSVKSLRGAIERGELAVIRPNTKNLYVTRRAIREWLERCQGQKNQHISSFAAPGGTGKAGSHIKPSTSSKTASNKLALDAARTILKGLKSNSTTTSSGNTRKK